jgi:hypothetical protein
MKIKDRNNILTDIIKDADHHPNNWTAVFGKDYYHLSSDYYLFHPNVGLYLIKEYNKNPYVQRGVGGKIARYVDEDFEKTIKKFSGNFGIIQGDIHKITSHLQKGLHPNRIIEAAIKGKDLGLRIPVQGKASSSNESFSSLKDQYKPSRKKIDSAFQKMAKKDGIYQAYE